MKKLLCAILIAAMLAGCAAAPAETAPETDDAVRIELSDSGITLKNYDPFDRDAVITNNQIVYYEAGHGEDYGEGEEFEEHTAGEADGHWGILITVPGTYRISGKLSQGQIAVDLGEGAKDDPNAVVTLILDGVDITCTVAPAIIFYNVYESGEPDGPAGACVILAEGSRNKVRGSHVAKIYKPGTEDTLHKYDGAFYSRMSMSIGGGGELAVFADNEGLCSEMHLSIYGGIISILSANDCINTNADGESVTTISGGQLTLRCTGTSGEGDGIDSNGSIVIRGGIVEAFACGTSQDSGLDADLGILISGGIVIATGNMLDRIEDGSQTHAVFSFAQTQSGGSYALKNEKGTALFETDAPNAFTNLIFSSPSLVEGNYTLWSGDTQFEGVAGQGGGPFFGEMQPIERPDRPDWPGRGDGDVEIPPQPTNPVVTHGTVQPPQGEQPEKMPVPPMPEGSGDMPVPPMPQGSEEMPMPGMPEGVEPSKGGGENFILIPVTGVLSAEFPITRGANYFSGVRPVE